MYQHSPTAMQNSKILPGTIPQTFVFLGRGKFVSVLRKWTETLLQQCSEPVCDTFFDDLTALLEIVVTFRSQIVITGDFNIHVNDSDDHHVSRLPALNVWPCTIRVAANSSSRKHSRSADHQSWGPTSGVHCRSPWCHLRSRTGGLSLPQPVCRLERGANGPAMEESGSIRPEACSDVHCSVLGGRDVTWQVCGWALRSLRRHLQANRWQPCASFHLRGSTTTVGRSGVERDCSIGATGSPGVTGIELHGWSRCVPCMFCKNGRRTSTGRHASPTKLEIQGRGGIRFQRFFGGAKIHPFSRDASLQTSYQSFSKIR